MKRREFITLVGTAAWPISAWAQNSVDTRLVGVLWGGLIAGTPEANAAVATLANKLRDLGWQPDKLRFEHRWFIAGSQQSSELAKELVGLRPHVVVVNSTPLLTALENESHTIPIVFVRVADPVGQGFVKSLARPGGNASGFTNFEFSMGGKWLELIQEVAPRTERIGIIFNPNTVPYAYFLKAIESAAPSLALTLVPSPAERADDIEAKAAAFAQKSGGGLLILPDIFNIEHRALIIRLAAQYALPAIYPYGLFAKDGGLISYGIDPIAIYSDAATYVDRILRGGTPADPPVQAPTKFELIINLRTAKALGLNMPAALLAGADEVIE
jgi:putative ABC transport system substrate-binding protein